MIYRRPLAELLSELGGSAQQLAATPLVRPRSVLMTLPIDCRLAEVDGKAVILGDAPLFRTRTAFDAEPAMLRVEFLAQPFEAEPLP